jgi:metal-responsive CopG/Arc/MetJ family transcriptional regulator
MEKRAQPLAGTLSEPKTVRASVGFPAELYKALDEIAQEKKVSVAWIVRDAAEQYIAQRWPLLNITRSQSKAITN